ncbi:MAG: hypothetical protein ACTHY4_08570 [Flavobacteriaceae bacterium]|nr:hypothetical protein [Psychroflexus sp.]
MDLNYETQSGNIVEIEFGFLKILKNGTAYELSFEGIDEEDNEVCALLQRHFKND